MAKATTALTKAKPNNLPATTKAMFAQELAELQKRINAPSGDKISTKGKVFTLPNGTQLDELEALIVDFSTPNLFYQDGYQEGSVTPPICFAMGFEPAGLIPSENSPEKQAESCAVCWANQFKSAGNGKACSNLRLLALLPPDADVETPLMILKVSATALKNFDGYVSSVARSKGMPIRGVITKITFNPEVTYPSLRFNMLEDAQMDLIEMANNRLEEARQRIIAEPDVSALTAANDGGGSKPAQKRTLGKVAPKKPAPRRAA